jgi:hypothetical protein
VRVDRWAAARPGCAWTTIEVRPGEKGPLVVEALKRRVAAKTDRRRAGPEEVLVVFREKQADGTSYDSEKSPQLVGGAWGRAGG